MRKLLFLLLFSISIQFAYSQGTAQDSAWIRENYYKMETYIPMRDGVKAFHHHLCSKRFDTKTSDPDDPNALLLRSIRTGEVAQFLRSGYLRYYLQEGYIMVTQDVRGRWMSEGTFRRCPPVQQRQKDKHGCRRSQRYL